MASWILPTVQSEQATGEKEARVLKEKYPQPTHSEEKCKAIEWPYCSYTLSFDKCVTPFTVPYSAISHLDNRPFSFLSKIDGLHLSFTLITRFSLCHTESVILETDKCYLFG